LSVLALLKKFAKNGIEVANELFDAITSYLLDNADSTKETAQTVAECFLLLIRIRPNSAPTFLDLIVPDALASPVILQAMTIFLASADSETVSQLIQLVINKIDVDQPILSEPAIAVFEIGLKFEELREILVSYLPTLTESVRRRGSHSVDVRRGFEQGKVDVGVAFQRSAISAIKVIYQTIPGLGSFDELCKAVRAAQEKKQPVEIQERGLALLTAMAGNQFLAPSLLESLSGVAELLPPIDMKIFNEHDQVLSLQVPYLTTLVALSRFFFPLFFLEFTLPIL
jgi:hypothetical protein